MSNINAESVKAKLQGLITSANAKTGKSDANLTDAVKTLLEGYGQGGGGGGECPITVVDTLPEVGVEGTTYGVNSLAEVIVVDGGSPMPYIQLLTAFGYTVGVSVTTSDKMKDFEGVTAGIWYLTDIPDVYISLEGGTVATATSLSSNGAGTFNGEFTADMDITTLQNGYYIVKGVKLYQYTGGQFKEYYLKGSVTFESNGDGTCKVSGIEDNYDNKLVIPSVAPSGDTVTSIKKRAFTTYGDPNVFLYVIIPETVTEIGESAFEHTLFKNISIPNSVTTIGDDAFRYNIALEEITLPNSITSLGEYAVADCSSLKKATINSVGNLAATFQNCNSLDEVTVGSSVTSLSYTFSNCYSLATVTLSDGLKIIGTSAFQHCKSLNNITIPDSVETIGLYAFSNCDGLSSATISSGVIGQYSFFYCRQLSNVTIGRGVTTIGVGAFYGCTALTTVTMGENSQLTSIDSSAFNSCSSLTSITITGGVTSIGSGAFYGCSSLTSITFEGTAAQWKAITKGESWNKNVPATKVVCTDGEVAL